MQILSDDDIQVVNGSYMKFHDLSLTDLTPEQIVKKLISESVNFERGKDPKSTMGIGRWEHGYMVDSWGDQEIPAYGTDGYVRFDFKGEEWGWSKKAFSPGEIGKTEVLPHMEKILKKLPVVTFKTYYGSGTDTGLFGDWPPEKFPFTKTPFIANVLEDKGRSFLIDPEGYDYPRYITELV